MIMELHESVTYVTMQEKYFLLSHLFWLVGVLLVSIVKKKRKHSQHLSKKDEMSPTGENFNKLSHSIIR